MKRRTVRTACGLLLLFGWLAPTASAEAARSSIYRTIDGGLHWAKEYGTDATDFDAVSFPDPMHGWATGHNNLVLRTANGGGTWVAQDVGAAALTAITGVTAIDAKRAWIAGWYGFVAVTTDRGRTWRREHIRGTGDVNFEDALFVDAHEGWVGGDICI